jgi:hypothetical protein
MPVLLPRKRNKIGAKLRSCQYSGGYPQSNVRCAPLSTPEPIILYSGRKPDLTEESWHFQPAVHRIWLYTSIFPGDRYSLDDINELDHDKLTSFSASVRLCLMNIRPTNSFKSTPSCVSSAES